MIGSIGDKRASLCFQRPFSFCCIMVSDQQANAAAAAAAKLLQSCPTLCDPIDGSPPGSSTHGIFQARVLEWGAIAFSNTGKWKD